MKSLLLLYLVVICFSDGLRIASEVPTDLSIQLCSHQRKQTTHDHMQFFPEPVTFCTSLRSNKNQRHLASDLRSSTSHTTQVRISWKRPNSAKMCTVTFKGYQGEYRISPDFGVYEQCQYALSRHLYALSEALAQDGALTRQISFNTTSDECAITNLPTTYTDYISCGLTLNEWYILNWQSTIHYETFYDGNYGSYWSNHSTTFVLQPTMELHRNGSDIDWMSRLISIETKTSACDLALLLIRIDAHWPTPIPITVVYRVRNGNVKIHTEQLYNSTVDRWMTLDFPLYSSIGIHQICLQTPHLLPKQTLCRRIVDHLDCPFPITNRQFAINYRILIIFLIFMLLF